MEIDFGTISQTLGLIRTTADTGTTLAKAAESLQSLAGSKKSGQEAELIARISALDGHIADAQLANTDLKKLVAKLENELLELGKSLDKFKGYELHETPSGGIVYKSPEGVAPVHYVCPNCKDGGTKSLLQGDKYVKQCPSCQYCFDFDRRPAPLL